MKPTRVENWLESSQQDTPYQLDFYTPFKEMVRQKSVDHATAKPKRKEAPLLLEPFAPPRSTLKESHIDAVSPSGSSEKYRRRPRAKVRRDRYVYKKEKKSIGLAPRKPTNQSTKHSHSTKARPRPQANFQAPNAGSSRLALKGQSGLFKDGRASAPIARSGVPDLAFSEQAFLNLTRAWAEENSRRQAEGVFATDPDADRRIRRRKEEEAYISKYFGAPSPDCVYGQHRDARRSSDTFVYETPCRPFRGEPNLRSSPTVDLELPGKPYLGFGERGPVAYGKPAARTKFQSQDPDRSLNGDKNVVRQSSILQSSDTCNSTEKLKGCFGKPEVSSDPRAQHSPTSNYEFARRQASLQKRGGISILIPGSGDQLVADKQEEILNLLRGLCHPLKQSEPRFRPRSSCEGYHRHEDRCGETGRGENTKDMHLDVSDSHTDEHNEPAEIDQTRKDTKSDLERDVRNQQNIHAFPARDSASSSSSSLADDRAGVQDGSNQRDNLSSDPSNRDVGIQTVGMGEACESSQLSKGSASTSATTAETPILDVDYSGQNNANGSSRITLNHRMNPQPDPTLQVKGLVNKAPEGTEPVLDSIPAIGLVRPASGAPSQCAKSATRSACAPMPYTIYERQLRLDALNGGSNHPNSSDGIGSSIYAHHRLLKSSGHHKPVPPDLDPVHDNSSDALGSNLFSRRHYRFWGNQVGEHETSPSTIYAGWSQHTSSSVNVDEVIQRNTSVHYDFSDSELCAGAHEGERGADEQDRRAFGTNVGSSTLQDDGSSREPHAEDAENFRLPSMAFSPEMDAGRALSTFWRPNLLY